MRRSRVLLVPLALSIAGGATACGDSLSEGGKGGEGGGDSVKVALLVPKSGVYAPLGKDMEQGFRHYLSEHGEKLGGKKVEVQVVDEGAGPDTGVPAGAKLAADSSVDVVVGVVNSATALGLKKTFDEAKKPLIIANAGANDITKTPSDFIWRTSFTNNEVGSSMGKYAAQAAKGGSVYLVGPDYAAGKEFLAGFRSSFEAAGGKVAGTSMTPFGKTQNFQPYLQNIRKAKPKGVFGFYAGAEAVSFVKQYSEMGLHDQYPFYATGFATEGGVLKAQGKAAEGIKTSLHYSSELDNPVNKKFAAGYSKKYSVPPTVYSVQAYDAAAVLDKALKSGSSTQDVVAGLKKTGTVDSPRGPWTFSDTHSVKQTYYLREVTSKGGKQVNAVKGELAKP